MLNSFLLFFGVIALIVIPILIANSRKSQKSMLLLQKIKSEAEKEEGQIDAHETLNRLIIGLDKKKQAVYIYRLTPAEEYFTKVDLKNFDRCKVHEISRLENYKGQGAKVFDTVGLSFVPKDKKQSLLTVEFYNAATDGLTLTGQSLLAERWARTINESMRKA